jgi:Sjoegren syndrome nuclear autoantigen 1
MAAQGATLQNYNNELVKCIEDLREKREEVNRAILKEEEVRPTAPRSATPRFMDAHVHRRKPKFKRT